MAEGTVEQVLAGTATWCVVHGNILDVLPSLPEAVFDACLTDPPYHLTSVSRNGSPRTNDPAKPQGRHAIGSKGFMGRTWDGGDVAMRPETWALVYRALKPGAHLLAFGGTRTYHRIACAIEDGGFEIRDSILAFVHGQGFPKSLNASKALDAHFGVESPVVRPGASGKGAPSVAAYGDGLNVGFRARPATEPATEWRGYGTALKPSFEPIALARKPLDGTLAENLLKWGCGGLNVDGCRVAHSSAADRAAHEDQVASIKARGGSMAESWKNSSDLAGASDVNDAGRWPPNCLLQHSPGCRKAGVSSVSANPTWDTPNRNTEPSAFTGSDVSKVRHANGRDGEPSADRRYTDQGATSFAPLPGARRDDTESVDVWDCVEGCPVRELAIQSGERPSISGPNPARGRHGMWGLTGEGSGAVGIGDSGSAARYFPQSEWDPEFDDITPFLYTAKPARSETDAGLQHFAPRSGGEATDREDGSAGTNSPRAGSGRTGGIRNVHPTKKSIELDRWLARLARPVVKTNAPKPLLLVTFCGSGSEAIAGLLEGYRVIAIELNNTDAEPYVEIARARMHHIEGRDFVPRASLRAAEPPKQASLFEVGT